MGDKLENYIDWIIPDIEIGRCALRFFSRTETELKIVLLAGNDQFFEIELIFELKDIVGFKLANDSYSWRSDSARTTRRTDYSLFKVENSKYIEWFKAETYGVGDLDGVIHFSLLLADESLDIVSFNSPEIKVMD
ncbi:hypothetical protein ALP03_200035 [Pseudomonas amygdali pv. tabaci]|uniref:Uncharacterized protein n=1 Tax=Pseudomonas amygdali pv. tabaci TaxID=322 RepID=A0A3M6GL93_PSEAJ|nr:hypothetical protein ALP03_200035 [Pseudomonas amygdali pv. tabaci]